MFDNYFFLKRLSKELNRELKSFKFFRAVSQSKNELVTGFYNESEEKFLIFSFQKLPPLLTIKYDFAFAKKNFAEFFKTLSNAEINLITIDEFERNIRIIFGDFELVILFRGNHSNVVLIDKNKIIIDAFKKPDELIGKNFSEIFPANNLDVSYFTNEEKFNQLFEVNDASSKKYLKVLGNILVEEIKFRTEKNSKSYFYNFNQILKEFEQSPPLIYDDSIISFCSLQSLETEPKVAENLFEDLSRIYFSIQKNEDIQKLKEKILKKLKSDYEYHFKKLQELEKPENFIDRSEEFRQMGNLILINAHQIRKGDKIFKIKFEDKEYKIKLDPAKTPFQNADEYFQKAKEENSRLNSLRNLIEKEKNELEKIKEALDEVENSTDKKQLQKFMNEQSQQSQEKEIKKHFRHFLLEDKYEVYVGKDSKSNDLLTLEFAKPDDLWFHARGVSGSHVIIRRQNRKEVIPKHIIQKAASIAAYYSKARNSKLVPVAYTEKKYVIKRKGMPAGTVQLQKENVILVEPKVPEQTSED